jgi:hypothetical protein
LKIAQRAPGFSSFGLLERPLDQVDHGVEVNPTNSGYASREENDDLFPGPYPKLFMQSIVAGDLHEKKVVPVVPEEWLILPALWGQMMDVPSLAVPLSDQSLGEYRVDADALARKEILLPSLEVFYPECHAKHASG